MSVSVLVAREIQLIELQKLIHESKSKLNKILNELEWTPEETLRLRQEKHKANEEESYWPPARHSIKLDMEEFNSVAAGLSATDRKLAIYEYCIEKTGRLSEPEMSIMIQPTDGGSKKVMTFAEIVAKKRNAKRRTVRYRTGATQSYSDEVRNLIELQMSALRQYVSDTKKVKNSDKEDRYNSDKRYNSDSVSRYREHDKPSTSSYQYGHDRYGSEKQSSSSSLSSSRKHKTKEKGRIPRHHYDSHR